MAYSTHEISENVKQARENALVGNYEESNVFYSGAIQGVQQMFKTAPDPDMKQKWKQVIKYCSLDLSFYSLCTLLFFQCLNMLTDEQELVKSLSSTLSSFKEEPGMAAGGARTSEQPRDRDVWPPPTPQEPR